MFGQIFLCGLYNSYFMLFVGYNNFYGTSLKKCKQGRSHIYFSVQLTNIKLKPEFLSFDTKIMLPRSFQLFW